MPSGGARPGSGRKKNAEKYESQLNQAHDKIAGKFPQLVDVMLKSALKGHKLVKEVLEPAATVMVDDVEIQDGANGPVSVRIKRLAFPDLEPDAMVVVQRVITQTAPDREAGKYLLNRIAGTPTQMVELEAANKQELPATLEQAMVEAYGPEAGDDESDAGEDLDFLNERDDDEAEDEI